MRCSSATCPLCVAGPTVACLGGLAAGPEQAPEGSAGRLFEMADDMAGKSEVVEGAWVRRIELDNPAP